MHVEHFLVVIIFISCFYNDAQPPSTSECSKRWKRELSSVQWQRRRRLLRMPLSTWRPITLWGGSLGDRPPPLCHFSLTHSILSLPTTSTLQSLLLLLLLLAEYTVWLQNWTMSIIINSGWLLVATDVPWSLGRHPATGKQAVQRETGMSELAFMWWCFLYLVNCPKGGAVAINRCTCGVRK